MIAAARGACTNKVMPEGSDAVADLSGASPARAAKALAGLATLAVGAARSGVTAVKPWAAAANKEVRRRVSLSRRNGVLRKRRNRRVAAALTLIFMFAAVWWSISLALRAMALVMYTIGLGGIFGSGYDGSGTVTFVNSNGYATVSLTSQTKARIDAQAQAVLNVQNSARDAKERREREASAASFSDEFEQFEQSKGARLLDDDKGRDEDELGIDGEEEEEVDGGETIDESGGGSGTRQKRASVPTDQEETRSNNKRRASAVSKAFAQKKKSLIDNFRSQRTFVVLTEELNDGNDGLLRGRRRRHERINPSKNDASRELYTESAAGLMDASLRRLGYSKRGSADGLVDPDLMWLVAPGLECEGSAVRSAIARIRDPGGVIVLCHGDGQWVGHLGRKDVLDQRLRWLDVRLHRFHDCPMYSDFVPSTYIVNHATELGVLEKSLRAEQGLGALRTNGPPLFVVKHQKMPSELPKSTTSNIVTVPAVSSNPLKSIKTIRKRGHDMEGLVIQPYKSNPLLWEGKKFTLRTWAFVVSSSPLIALYHDGVIMRSLDRHATRTPDAHVKNARKRHRRGSSMSDYEAGYFANITSRQELHPEFPSRNSEAFGCMDDFQAYLRAAYPKSTEMSHYTDLILRPYLKRLMLFTLRALRREHEHVARVWSTQQLCFDYLIDGNWNVWLLDASPDCGGPQSSSNGGGAGMNEDGLKCQRKAVDALGVRALKVSEQMLASRQLGLLSKDKDEDEDEDGHEQRSWLDGIDLGSFDVLFDETAPLPPQAPGHFQSEDTDSRAEKAICKRSLYQDFRDRQTFSKRAVQSLFPPNGLPKPFSDAELGMDRKDRSPWKCSVCGYLNSAHARRCDNCGAAEVNGIESILRGDRPISSISADLAAHNQHHHEHSHASDDDDIHAFHNSKDSFSHSTGRNQKRDESVSIMDFASEGNKGRPETRQDLDHFVAGMSTHPTEGLQHDFERDGIIKDQPMPMPMPMPTPLRAMPVTANMCAGKKFDIKHSVQIVGHDIEPLRTSTYHACCSSCAINSRCKGFTFIAETFQCWIKEDVGSEGHQEGVVSGVLHGFTDGSSPTSVFRPEPRYQHSSMQDASREAYRQQHVHHDSDSARREYYRKRLSAIFLEHDPNKLAKVDILLSRYKGNEERFLLRTRQQYESIARLQKDRRFSKARFGSGMQSSDTDESAAAAAAAAATWSSAKDGPSAASIIAGNTAPSRAVHRDEHGLTRGDYRERLVEVFQQNDPTKIGEVDNMLDHFSGKEMQLVEYLLAKYK